MRLKRHQLRAVEFAMTRKHSYLALDPGLGKTACAAKLAKLSGKRVIYICPPFLFVNVMSEFEQWGAGELIYIFPDSVIDRESERRFIQRLVAKGFSDTLIVDEAHRFKDKDALRTKSLFGHRSSKAEKLNGIGDTAGLVKAGFTRVVMMSGTPMPNRPIELWAVLSALAAHTIDWLSHFAYALKWCGAFRRFGRWDFTGGGQDEIKDLARRIKKPFRGRPAFMLRMRKKDVLKELPPKIEEIFVLAGAMKSELRKLDEGLSTRYDKDLDRVQHELGAKHQATYQRLLGEAKALYAVEYIEYLLETTNEALLIFARHISVVDALARKLKKWKPIVVDGKTKIGDRSKLVGDFQKGRSRLLIGNYLRLGTGFPIQRADRVLFVEFSWNPGENDQASDRPHRIGRTQPVLVQYLVFGGSIDQRVIESVLKKRRNARHV